MPMKLFSLFLHLFGDNIDSRIIITTKGHDIASLDFLDCQFLCEFGILNIKVTELLYV